MISEFLKQKLITQYGNDLTANILNSYQEYRLVSLRINTLKTTKEEVLNELTKNNISYSEVSWSLNALTIPNNTEEDLKKLSIYKEGSIYLQSLSSQLPPLFLNPQANELILDMTAAPGGKTTEIAALSNNQAMITAIEKNKIRSERLQYNINKLGAKKITVLNTDARHLDEYFIFDKILLDAPCSGSGTLNPHTINNFTEELLNRSLKYQKSLLNEAIKHLKVGGELLYSTCSILKEENEQNIINLLKENPNLKIIPLDLSQYQDLPLLPTTINGCLCLKPTKYYEGFFICKLKKIN